MRRFTLLLLMLVFLVPSEGWGRVLTAGEDGVPDGNALAATIEAAGDGDTVLVYPGLYESVSLRIVDKQIVLKSLEGPEKTILDGSRVFRPLWLFDADQSVVEGFTIQNGFDRRTGGAAYVRGDTHAILRHNIMKDSYADYGGAVYVVGGAIVELEGNLFVGNGAIKRGGAVYCQGSELRLRGNTFVRNNADLSGAAVSLYNTRATVERNIFAEHKDLAAIYLHDTGCDIQLRCNGFWKNSAGPLAGGEGVALPENSSALTEDPRFTDQKHYMPAAGSAYRGGKCGDVGWSL